MNRGGFLSSMLAAGAAAMFLPGAGRRWVKQTDSGLYVELPGHKIIRGKAFKWGHPSISFMPGDIVDVVWNDGLGRETLVCLEPSTKIDERTFDLKLTVLTSAPT